MRRSVSALAAIRRVQKGRTLWLARWNTKWSRYHFVGGHKHAEESFRECITRELGEELDLQEHTDFIVSPAPLCHAEFTDWSESAKADTLYAMELFDVDLIGETAPGKLAADPEVRWLSPEEIRTCRCTDGRPVSPTMARLLANSGQLPIEEQD